MKKMLLITVFTMLSLLNADCLGDNPGEVYFKAFIKDNNGNYTRPALYKTSDYGQTAQVVIPDFDAFIHKDKTPGGYYKIPVGSSQLYYSADTCKTWKWQSVIASGNFKTGVFPGECYSASNVSKDYGKTWTYKPWNGIPGEVYSSCLGLIPGEMYAYPYNQKLYRSTDYGENFTMVSSPNLGAGGVGRGWIPGEILLTTSNDRKRYRSLDSGQTFNYLAQIPDAVNMANSLNGYQQDEVVLVKINRYPSMIYNQMKITFYKTTDWYQTVDSVETNYNVGIVENGELTMHNLQLANYPNPFNNTTVINYSLSDDNNINLAVYNAKGEIVRSLFKGSQSAGTHQITFNASGLNSGVYYIRAKGKNITQTIKCLLVK